MFVIKDQVCDALYPAPFYGKQQGCRDTRRCLATQVPLIRPLCNRGTLSPHILDRGSLLKTCCKPLHWVFVWESWLWQVGWDQSRKCCGWQDSLKGLFIMPWTDLLSLNSHHGQPGWKFWPAFLALFHWIDGRDPVHFSSEWSGLQMKRAAARISLRETLASCVGGYIGVWSEMTHFKLGFWVKQRFSWPTHIWLIYQWWIKDKTLLAKAHLKYFSFFLLSFFSSSDSADYFLFDFLWQAKWRKLWKVAMLLVFYFTKAQLCILRSNWNLIIDFRREQI